MGVPETTLSRAPTVDEVVPRRPSVRRMPRSHQLVLALVAAVGLARGLFWAATTEVWNPIDETAHFGYVESIATGHGIPEVGKDLVSVEVLGVAKTSPTYFFRYQPYKVATADGNWGGTRHQYEAVQGPIYYALLVPAYWVGRPFGFLPAVYAVRTASVVLALLAVPLAWLLARELFPRHPAVWLLTPAFLVMVDGFNANVASVSNDALVITGSLAATIAFARIRTTASRRSAIVAGALVGACVVNKTTSLALVPFLGALFVAVLWQRRAEWRLLARWAVAFTIAGAVTVAPWIAFNVATYGGISASDQVSKITGNAQQKVDLSAHGLRLQAEGSQAGFWELQSRSPGRAAYADQLDAMLIGALVVGVVGALVRGRRDDAGNLAWLALALPSSFIVMSLIVFGIFGGNGIAIGRHYYVALVPVVLAIVAGVVIALGPRFGVAAVLTLIFVAAVREQHVVDHYVAAAYLRGMVHGEAPAVEQSWADGDALESGVVLRPPCPTRYFSLAFSNESPPEVDVASGAGHSPARLISSSDGFSDYEAAAPLAGSATVSFPRTYLRSADRDRDPAASFADGTEDPLVRIYCPSAHPERARFEQVYSPQHPSWVTWRLVRWWPRAWTALAAVAAAAAAAGAVRGRRLQGSAPAGEAVAEPRA